jgi:hypothetical protein
MHRLIARFLLLFALVGNLIPIALAAIATPPHACCVRKTAHHCHGSLGSDPEQISFHARNCCSHDCRGAVTADRWAHPRPSATALAALQVQPRGIRSTSATPAVVAFSIRSVRAPPAC